MCTEASVLLCDPMSQVYPLCLYSSIDIICVHKHVLLCDPMSHVCTFCACVLPLVLYAYTSLAAFLWSHFTSMYTLCMCSGIGITCNHEPWCFCDPMSQVCTLFACVLVLILHGYTSPGASVIPCHKYVHFILVFWYYGNVNTQGFVWKFLWPYINFHSFINITCIHEPQLFCVIPCHKYVHFVLVLWYWYYMDTQALALFWSHVTGKFMCLWY